MVRLTNLKMDRMIVFDNETYVLNEKDLGNSKIGLSSYDAGAAIGSKITAHHVESRDISLVGYILASNEKEMLERKRNLQKLVSVDSSFYLFIDEYKIEIHPESTVEYAVDFKENNKFLCKFLVKGIAANPCFTDSFSKRVPLAYWSPKFSFPLAINQEKKIVMGIKEPSQIKMIENEGEVEVGMVIKIKSIMDGVKNPTILNLLTQEQMMIHYTLNKGHEIIINTSWGEKAVLVDGEKHMEILDIDSDFLQLHVGENYLRYDAEAHCEGLDIEVEYIPQYLEV